MRRIELYGSRLAVRKTLIPIIKVSVRRNSRSWVLNDVYNHPKMKDSLIGKNAGIWPPLPRNVSSNLTNHFPFSLTRNLQGLLWEY